MQEVDHYYLSAEKYSKATGMGVEEVKKLCRSNQIEHYMTEGGYYKIKVYKNGSIPLTQYEAIVKENVELKTKLNSIKAVLV